MRGPTKARPRRRVGVMQGDGAPLQPVTFDQGQRVHARRCDQRSYVDQRWYPATVTGQDATNGTFAVVFDDGTLGQGLATVDLRRLLRVDSTPPAEALFKFEERVRARYKGGPTWYDGRVKSVERSCNGWLFDVAYDDGDFEARVPETRIQGTDPIVRLDRRGTWFHEQVPQLETPLVLDAALADRLRPDHALAARPPPVAGGEKPSSPSPPCPVPPEDLEVSQNVNRDMKGPSRPPTSAPRHASTVDVSLQDAMLASAEINLWCHDTLPTDAEEGAATNAPPLLAGGCTQGTDEIRGELSLPPNVPMGAEVPSVLEASDGSRTASPSDTEGAPGDSCAHLFYSPMGTGAMDEAQEEDSSQKGHCILTTSNSAGRPARLDRCGSCANCLRADCGRCGNCLDKRKFGGPAIKKQMCLQRVCAYRVQKKQAQAINWRAAMTARPGRTKVADAEAKARKVKPRKFSPQEDAMILTCYSVLSGGDTSRSGGIWSRIAPTINAALKTGATSCVAISHQKQR